MFETKLIWKFSQSVSRSLFFFSWIRSVAFAWRSFFALKPKTKISASKTFDLPEPFGPTTADMFESNGPIVTSLAYDLKFSRIIFWMTSRGGALVARASDMIAAREVCGA